MSLLFQRPDFRDLVSEAARASEIPNPEIVEKDYYVTEALRLIASDFGNAVIFKGGTSLSKGWNLIRRFSEDIDLFIAPGDRGTKARNTLLKLLAATVDRHPALAIDETRTQRIDGLARSTTHAYKPIVVLRHGIRAGGDIVAQRIESTGSVEAKGDIRATSIRAQDVTAGGRVTVPDGIELVPGLAPSILLEAGIQSGTFPTEVRPITSIVGSFLREHGVTLDSSELESFDIPVLHFRRTFVEKMYALHDKVARGRLQDGQPIRGYARHYYDISQLIKRPEVQEMLDSGEFAEIALDYRRLTSLYFPNQLLPDGMSLHESPALYPTAELKVELAREYVAQCDVLCYGVYPAFIDLLADLEEVRTALQIDV